MKHFLTLLDISAEDARRILARARELKSMCKSGVPHRLLPGKTLALLFDKASTRTRVSFEVGMYQLGGHTLYLHSSMTQLGRGEPIEDTARVLSRMVDGVVIRTHEHENLLCFARFSRVPVINGLTSLTHPCQILADVLTYEEHRSSIRGKKIAWIGDGNNVAHSWINGAVTFGYRLWLACPPNFGPDETLLHTARQLGAEVHLTHDPLKAAENADLVTTDVWTSMGQEGEAEERRKAFAGFCVDQRLMAHAKPDAIFMHCLPAHRGEEVAPEIIDGPQSVVWDEAENRLHAQKALLEFLLA